MNIQVKDFTDEEMLNEAKEILEVGYTFHYEQNFTRSELVDYCRRIGNTDDDKLGYMPFNPKDTPDLSFVTPDGMFGHSDLHWHSNGAMEHINDFKEILIALYCDTSCQDTVFSLLNSRDAFLDLSNEEKDFWRSIEIQLNAGKGGIMGKHSVLNMESQATKKTGNLEGYILMTPHQDERMPAVNIHPIGGHEFLYWQPPCIQRAWQDGKEIEIESLQEKYSNVLERTQYIKDIVFRPGDFLIMDQLYTLHRRSPVLSKERNLWRVAFDYTNTLDRN
jgi:alpha-ketoglutarate-dependent taurine dioxygenase